jgi:hypothetical protein
MGDWIVGGIVVLVYGIITTILIQRHRRQKSVCARCLSTQETPSWIQDYKKERLK